MKILNEKFVNAVMKLVNLKDHYKKIFINNKKFQEKYL